jgi:hypothetical protein
MTQISVYSSLNTPPIQAASLLLSPNLIFFAVRIFLRASDLDNESVHISMNIFWNHRVYVIQEEELLAESFLMISFVFESCS